MYSAKYGMATFRNTPELNNLQTMANNIDHPISFAEGESDAKVHSEMVSVVDSNADVRKTLTVLLNSCDIDAISFESAEAYLNFASSNVSGCVILEMQLPDTNALDLQKLLAKSDTPIVFLSTHSDIPSIVRVMKAGAVEVLTKPVEPDLLIQATKTALSQASKLRQKRADLAMLQDRFSLLTPREKEVLSLVVGGLLNKQVAAVLGIALVTVQVHRGQIMRKMAAGSFAELVRMAMKLRIPHHMECQSFR